MTRYKDSTKNRNMMMKKGEFIIITTEIHTSHTLQEHFFASQKEPPHVSRSGKYNNNNKN